jgi:dihydrofolate synthase/folylpolyglutamate synthase
MTYAEAIQFLYDLRLFGAKFGLENTFKLAALAGNPQKQLRFIHVAGTNGKGSTCAMLESIYRASGLRVGLFTSPHLVSFRERIQVNRQLISEAEVVRLTEELRRLSSVSRLQTTSEPAEAGTTNLMHPDRQDACPTFFEFVTVMALKFFAEQKCDLVIWETGLGGRLDATNIVTPLAGVITNIALDHQQWLGDTLGKIAAEKAGIIKPGVPVITAADEPEALAVIEKTARERNVPLIKVGQASSLSLLFVPPNRNQKMETGKMPVLPLPGDHQQLNAALALATVETLQNKIPVSDEAVRTGLGAVDWPGRLQLVTRPSGQKILLDGAHNVAGARVLRQALEKYFGGTKRTLVLGVLQDKDWRHICKTLAPLAARILTVPVASERTADASELAAACRAANPSAEIGSGGSLAGALGKIEDDEFVVVTGSLYLVGEALELLGLLPALGGERGLNEWSEALHVPAQSIHPRPESGSSIPVARTANLCLPPDAGR